MYTHSTWWEGDFAYGMQDQLKAAQASFGFTDKTYDDMMFNIRWVRWVVLG